jgi:hypothetical protein
MLDSTLYFPVVINEDTEYTVTLNPEETAIARQRKPNNESTRNNRGRYSDWLRAGRPRGRSSSSGRVKNLLFSTSFRPALGSNHPPIQWVPGDLSLGVKRPGREADHSPPASAEVKKMWIYTSTPHTPSWPSA